MDKYSVTGRIGEGAHGVILLARDKSTQKELALKKVLVRDVEKGIPRQVIREIKTLEALDHKHIIKLLDHYIEDVSIVLVFDFMPSGIYEIIHDSSINLTESHLKTYMKMILSGVGYLHDRRIMHRDLKPGNILINESGVLKIADFGLARPLWPEVGGGKPYTHQVATRWYRAPEILYGAKHYTEAIDLWAVGCIFAELLNKTPLFPGETDIDQLALVIKNLGTPTESNWPGVRSLPDYNKITFPPSKPVPWEILLKDVNDHGRSLISSLVQYNSRKRPSANEALAHSYFFTRPYPAKESKMPKPPKDHRARVRASNTALMPQFDENFFNMDSLVEFFID